MPIMGVDIGHGIGGYQRHAGKTLHWQWLLLQEGIVLDRPSGTWVDPRPMPESGLRRRATLVRRSSKSTGLAKRSDDRGLVHRGGLLQSAEQRPEGHAGEAAAPVEFLIAFTRALIRNNPSGDSIALAMRSAQDICPLTPEQEVQFLRAVGVEVDRSPWPKGFF
jgi:hypothetical protein